ncbi:hypothetical protein NLJ89_g11294 [Agrocybe chaxingu]|uniref:Uncharacterized protein n=1 Tax=Agrocybe chaxingu TaxID=84603 RepID=A0A9W8JPH7_9AGAR|nr:hypothetical protein NLJ89_g11294 [Agrocybe chaxingu]
MLLSIMHDEDVQRVVMIADRHFNTFWPQLYGDYRENLQRLTEWRPSLRRIYPTSAFAASSINLGPRTVSHRHYDFANLAWGLCAITAFGNYDPDKGGHLVLWELKLVVRFPPGTTIIIPSAMVMHSNTPIQDGERRYSIAQYNSSGLFRFVDNGFMTDAAWDKQASNAAKDQRAEERKARWKRGLGRLSNRSDLM